MPEVQCARVRLRPGTTQRVLSFLTGLKDRPEEVQAALAREGVKLESLFLEKTAEADYVIFYMRAENLARATAVAQSSMHPFDVETRQFIQETWAEAYPLELIVDLERALQD